VTDLFIEFTQAAIQKNDGGTGYGGTGLRHSTPTI